MNVNLDISKSMKLYLHFFVNGVTNVKTAQIVSIATVKRIWKTHIVNAEQNLLWTWNWFSFIYLTGISCGDKCNQQNTSTTTTLVCQVGYFLDDGQCRECTKYVVLQFKVPLSAHGGTLYILNFLVNNGICQEQKFWFDYLTLLACRLLGCGFPVQRLTQASKCPVFLIIVLAKHSHKLQIRFMWLLYIFTSTYISNYKQLSLLTFFIFWCFRSGCKSEACKSFCSKQGNIVMSS